MIGICLRHCRPDLARHFDRGRNMRIVPALPTLRIRKAYSAVICTSLCPIFRVGGVSHCLALLILLSFFFLFPPLLPQDPAES